MILHHPIQDLVWANLRHKKTTGTTSWLIGTFFYSAYYPTYLVGLFRPVLTSDCQGHIPISLIAWVSWMHAESDFSLLASYQRSWQLIQNHFLSPFNLLWTKIIQIHQSIDGIQVCFMLSVGFFSIQTILYYDLGSNNC